MQANDIQHLASLARIRLSEVELSALQAQLPEIIAYVGAVSEMVGDEADEAPVVGPVHNVWRPDVVRHQPDQFTDALLAEAPDRHGRFLKVKKILQTDD